MRYYFILGDVATPYDSYEEAQEEFFDMLDYYEYYAASFSFFNADKVLVTTYSDNVLIDLYSDELYMAIVSEEDFAPMAHEFMIVEAINE